MKLEPVSRQQLPLPGQAYGLWLWCSQEACASLGFCQHLEGQGLGLRYGFSLMLVGARTPQQEVGSEAEQRGLQPCSATGSWLSPGATNLFRRGPA